MKKTTLLILLAASNISFAVDPIRLDYVAKPMVEGNTRAQELMDWNDAHPGEMPPLTDQEKEMIFGKSGMPLPGTGAVVIDNAKGLAVDSGHAKTIKSFNSSQKTKGFYEEANPHAKQLLAMPEMAEQEFNQRKGVAFSPTDTHLYEARGTIAMKYPYKGIPDKLSTKVIGYAPESTFVNGGWAGAVQFFVPSFGGVCAYHEINIEITKSSAFIPKEIATYDVNNKLTTHDVIGNKDTGFVYEVEWWDKKFRRSVECASPDYSKETAKQVLNLAQEIDTAL